MSESAVTEPGVVSWNAPKQGRAPSPRWASGRMTRSPQGQDAWLANFADDADRGPVARSMFDEEGKGHHGAEARAISGHHDRPPSRASSSRSTTPSPARTNASTSASSTPRLPNGYRASTEGVFHYADERRGQDRSLRAFWEWTG